jgi:hypothetical protein
VNGASGSIGTAAVQLAKHFGAVVTGVCSTPNIELVRSLGSDDVVEYTKTDFTPERAARDVIFDAVGKSSFARCRAALKPGGIYLTTVPTMANGVQTLWTSKLGAKRAVLGFTGLRQASAKAKAKDMAWLLVRRRESSSRSSTGTSRWSRPPTPTATSAPGARRAPSWSPTAHDNRGQSSSPPLIARALRCLSWSTVG